jgi:hypothetical protein
MRNKLATLVLALAAPGITVAGEGTSGSGNCPGPSCGLTPSFLRLGQAIPTGFNTVAFRLTPESTRLALSEVNQPAGSVTLSDPLRWEVHSALVESLDSPRHRAPMDLGTLVLVREVAEALRASLEATPTVNFALKAELLSSLARNLGLEFPAALPRAFLIDGVVVRVDRRAAEDFLSGQRPGLPKSAFVPFTGDRISGREVALTMEAVVAKRLHEGTPTAADLDDLVQSASAGLRGEVPAGFERCGSGSGPAGLCRR